MNYYDKYLSLLNNDKFIGGAIPRDHIESFRHKDEKDKRIHMHYPFTWNVQNNQFYRWSFILKLIKLAPDDIKVIIGPSNLQEYENFLNCILVILPADVNKKLSDFNKDEYDIHLKNEYVKNYPPEIKTSSKIPVGSHVVYVKNLINYFIVTHKILNDDLIISPEQDIETIRKYEEHLSLCRDYYYNWRICVNRFYGLKIHDGLIPRNTGDIPNEPDPTGNGKLVFKDVDGLGKAGLFYKLQEESAKNIINTKYNELTENNITTYLKVRCEGTEYNKRFNVYLEDEKIDGTGKSKPRSMYLTGPNPNHNIYYYKKNKGDDKIIPHVSQVSAQYPNLVLSVSGDNDVENIKKYEYGNLYGPFTKIFTPKQSNKEISENCKEILEKLRNNESVFVLGYGASGAGKTTALIYNKIAVKEEDKNGILLNILKDEHFRNITNIFVTVHELYSTKQDSMNFETKKYNKIKFTKQSDGEFVINNQDISGQYIEKIRSVVQPKAGDTIDTPDIKWEDKQYTWQIRNNVFSSNDPRLLCRSTMINGVKYLDPNCLDVDVNVTPRKITKLGEFILATVDNIRMINPTTNNPVSSRSHVLIYIQIPNVATNGTVSTTDYKHLIFGDLAGVENKFTCNKPNTKAQFLSLPEYDRITGKPIDNGKNADGTPIIKPHYTYNSKLSLRSIPYEGDSKLILDYFGYDPSNKMINDSTNLDLKNNILQILCGVKPWIIDSKFDNNIIALFPKPSLSGDQQIFSRMKVLFDNKMVALIFRQNFDLKLNERGDLPMTYELVQQIKAFMFATDDHTIDSKIFDNKDLLTPRDSFVNLITDPRSNLHNLFERFKVWYMEQKNPANVELSENKVAEYIHNGMDQLRFDSIPNLKQKIIDQILKYQEFSGLRPMLGNFSRYKTLIAGLYQDLIENLALLETSGVQKRCEDRRNEGEYINQALIGMSKDLSSLIQQLSSNSDVGLFKNIPLVKEACFKYFCNQDHESCFSQLEKNKDTDYNKSIIDDIKNILDAESPTVGGLKTYPKTNKLGIMVFAVLNINKDANDPSRIPYIDITKLKQIRDEYITYKFYYQDSDPIDGFKQSINTIFGTNESEGMWKILKEFENKIGPLSLEPIRLNNLIKTSNITNFFDNLKNLIESFDIINSLSVIGTMEFLNSIKNIYSTDIACNLIKDSPQDNRIPESFDLIKNYRNVMTKETLIGTISQQANDFKGNSGDIKSINLPIGPAYDVPAINTIDKILGGYMKKSKKSRRNNKNK